MIVSWFIICMVFLCVATRSLSRAFSPRVERVVGEHNVHIGAAVEWSHWNYSIWDIEKAFGFNPRAYVLFTHIPFTKDDLWVMDRILPSMAAMQQTVILTPEPFEGLESVTDPVVQETVEILKKWEDQGVTFIVRFAHEMNGSWYPWGQKPALFIEKFQVLSEALHAGTEYATILWAPNLGPGYPYHNGRYEAKCNGKRTSVDCTLLDTDGDGALTAGDDMFSPYWPGDEYVDWVGSSLYWWGKLYPWGENEVPSSQYFYNALVGKIKQETGELIPDFYSTYSQKKNLAMIITETAALYNLCDKHPLTKGCRINMLNGSINQRSEHSIKSAWWDQIFSLEGPTSTRERFPNIKMISWFNTRKKEAEIDNNTVDWTTYSTATIRESFLKTLNRKSNDGVRYWITG